MWINRKIWEDTARLNSGYAHELHQSLMAAQGQIADLQRQLREQIVKAQTAAQDAAHRIIGLIGDTRAAQTRATLLTIEVNSLREERAILLDKIMRDSGGFKPAIPHIGPGARTTEPAVSFEDMGDEQAAAAGLIPEPDPWPLEREPFDPTPETGFTDPPEGLAAPGTVYNPGQTGPAQY